MATKSRHDLLLEKIRSKYEGNKKAQTTVPEVQETQEQEDTGWSFKNDMLNLSRVSGNFQKNLYKSFESLLDTGTSLVGSGLELVGLDDASKSVHDFGARDLTQEYLNTDFNKWSSYLSGGPGVWLSGAGVDEWAESTYGQQERLPSIVAGLASGAGSLAGMILGSKALGAVGGLAGNVGAKVGQWGSIVGMSGGQSYEQALNEGASGLEATGYGILSGATEAIAEAVVGNLLAKIGLGTGKVLGIGKGTQTAIKTSASPLKTALTNIMKNFTEEGAEEVFSDLVNPILQNLTYKQGEKLAEVYGEELGTSFDEISSNLAETFIVGGLLGGISGAGAYVQGANRIGSLEGYNLTQEVTALEEVNDEIKKHYASNNQTKLQEALGKKKQIQEALQTKYAKFIEQVEKNRLSEDEIKTKLESEENYTKDFAQQLNKQVAVDQLNRQKSRDLRAEVAKEKVGASVTRGTVDVQIGEVQRKADGSYEHLQGSFWDENKKRIVLKSSQVKYNKLAEILGHEIKHVFESKELTNLLLEDLSEADYKRMYDETYKAYSQLEGFNQMSDEEQQQYIREEMSADILSGYFSNLNQMERAFKKMDAKGIAKLYYNIREMFDSNKKRFKNYNRVMELIEKTRGEVLEKYSKEQTTETTQTQETQRYKVDTESGIDEQVDRKNQKGHDDETNRRKPSEKNKREKENNVLYTRKWNINDSSRRVIDKIYNSEEQFLNKENRKIYDDIIYHQEGTYKKDNVDKYIVQEINEQFYTPTMQEIAEENQKLGIKTHFLCGPILNEKFRFEKWTGFYESPNNIYIRISTPDVISSNRHEKMHHFQWESFGVDFANGMLEYLRKNDTDLQNLVNLVESKYHYYLQAQQGKITQEEAYYSTLAEMKSFVYQKAFIFSDEQVQDNLIKTFDDALTAKFGFRPRFKLDNTSTETLTEEYINGVDEYGTKRLIEEPAGESVRYDIKVPRVEFKFDEKHDTLSTIEYTVKVNGEEKTIKLNGMSIVKKAIENYKKGTMPSIQLMSIKNTYVKWQDYLEHLMKGQNATKNKIEVALNYIYQIDKYVKQEIPNIDELIRTEVQGSSDFNVDLSKYYSQDSDIITAWNKILNPAYRKPIVKTETTEEKKVETPKNETKKKDTKKKETKVVEEKKEEESKKETTPKVKKTKAEVEQEIVSSFKEIVENYTEDSEIDLTDVHTLFDEKQYKKLQKSLKHLLKGWHTSTTVEDVTTQYYYYGLEYFYENVGNMDVGAEFIYNNFNEGIKVKINEVYNIVEENIPSWIETGNVGSINKAIDVINSMLNIVYKISDELIEIGEETYNQRKKVESSYDYDSLILSLDSSYDNGSKYYEIYNKLEQAVITIKNTNIQRQSIHTNIGKETTEAQGYGGTRTIDTSETRIQSEPNNSEEISTTTSEVESVESGSRVEEGQGLRNSSDGASEQSGNEPSGVHTDSETTVEPPQTDEVAPEEVFSTETIADSLQTEKVVITEYKEIVKNVFVRETRKKSVKNDKTVKAVADFYNEKVYDTKNDVAPLRETITKYLTKYYSQHMVAVGLGERMLDYEVMCILNSPDKNLSTEKRINAIYDVYKQFIKNPTKRMTEHIKSEIAKVMETGGKQSKMSKLVESFEKKREADILKYQAEVNKLLDTLVTKEEKIKVYKATIDQLNTEVAELMKNEKATSNELKKYRTRLNKLNAQLESLSQTNAELKSDYKALQKELKDVKKQLNKHIDKVIQLEAENKEVSTQQTKAETDAYGKKVIEEDFRAVLDEFNFEGIVDDGVTITSSKVDNKLYETIALQLSKNRIKDATNSFLQFVGEFEVVDENGNKTKLNDGSETWQALEQQVESLFREYVKNAKNSKTQNIRIEEQTLAKAVVSLLKTTYTINRKLARRGAVVQILTPMVENLVKGVGNPTISNLRSGAYRSIMSDLYKALTTKTDGLTITERVSTEFDPNILDLINQIGNNAKGKLSVEEVNNVKNIVEYISKYLTKSAGGTTYEGPDERYKGKTYREIAVEGIKKQKTLESRRKFDWFMSWLNPRVVFQYMDAFQDGVNTFIYQELERGETVEQETFMNLFGIMKKFYKTEDGKAIKKVINKNVTLRVDGYTDVTATVGQFMSLYKLLVRSDSKTHLANSGFSLQEKGRFSSELKEYHFNSEQLESFEKALIKHFDLNNNNSIYRKYINTTTKFFEEAKKLKVITDKDTKGYTNVIEGEEYFPIKIVAYDKLTQLGSVDYMSTNLQGSRNYSWNSSVEGLKGILDVSNIEQVIQVYSMQISKYVAYAKTVDMINTLFNYQVQETDKKFGIYKGETLRSVMTNQYGSKKGEPKIIAYYNKLLRDLQGIRSQEDGIFESARKRFATYALGANLKVMANQLSALPTALRYIHPINLIKAIATGGFTDVDTMPLTAQYRITEKTIVTAETLNDHLSKGAEIFGKGMNITDNLVIKMIWKACLIQCNNNVNEATELYNKTIRETQGFNTLQRSALLRSDNTLVKQMMMFTIQPSHNLSNLAECGLNFIENAKRGKKMTAEQKSKYVGSIVGVMLEGAIYTAIAIGFKFLLERDEEDELSIEKILQAYFNDTILGMIPFVGNNVEIDFMAEDLSKAIKIDDFNVGSISQIYEAMQEVMNIFDTTKSPEYKRKSLMYALGLATGIPTRNLNTYGTMIQKWVAPDSAYAWEIKSQGYTLYNKAFVNEAINKGQNKKAWNYYKYYTDYIVELDESTTKEMFNLYQSGYDNAYLKQIPYTIEADDLEVPTDKVKFVNTYSNVKDDLRRLMSSYNYKRLSDKDKTRLIKKVVDYHYNIAYKEQSGEDLTTMEHLVKENYITPKTLVYLNEIAEIEETSRMTRKEAVQKYINKLAIPASEKYVLYFLSGYKLNTQKTMLVKNYLKSKGVSKKTLNAIFE